MFDGFFILIMSFMFVGALYSLLFIPDMYKLVKRKYFRGKISVLEHMIESELLAAKYKMERAARSSS